MKNWLHFFILVGLISIFNLVLFFAPVIAATAPVPGTGPGAVAPVPDGGSGDFKIENPIDSKDFAVIMRKIANLVAMVALPLVVVMIIWAGAQFVFAQGNDTKLTAAKKTLWYSLLGALLVVGAYAIATAIENFAKKL